ncbi:MAG: PAS domain S-box protein [Maribacter arcticus]|uniref:PAS domain S-box protein n=1 Tax=Maribacter arcticus TaxID=561365 RepID=UPI003002A90F
MINSIEKLIRDLPVAISIVDAKLNLINYSDQWINSFAPKKTDIRGKHLNDILLDMPISFEEAIQSALKGNISLNEGEKIFLPKGEVKWLKWKISPYKNNDDTLEGLTIIIEDVSKDKKELELLHKAENVGRIGGWQINLETNQSYWTKTTRDIHEVDEDFIPSIEKGIHFVKENFREKVTNLITLALENHQPWDTQLIITTAKGNEVWVRAKGEVEILNNKCVGLIGTFQDITPQKLIELQFKKAKATILTEFNNSINGMAMLDERSKFIKVNKRLCQSLGYTAKEFMQMSFLDISYTENKAKEVTNFKDVFSGKINSPFKEKTCIHKSGNLIYGMLSQSLVKNIDGESSYLICTFQDLTTEKNVQIELSHFTESIQKIFKHSEIGMAFVTLNKGWKEVNHKFCDILGYSKEELLELNYSDITHTEDIGAELLFLKEIIDNKSESYRLEKRFIHKKGHVIYTIFTTTVVRKSDGEILHFIDQIIDITLKIEKEKELGTLVDITKNQNNSLMNFAQIVSHNLRSNSSNMTMLSNFLVEEEDEQEKSNIIDMISKSAESLSQTIDDLNDVVQLKTITLENLQSVSLAKTINQIQKSINGLLIEKKAILEIDIPKDHAVKAVSAYLESIFLNIVTNALKYSSEDRTPVIKINSQLQGDNILLSFSDNGQGIDLKRHGDKVFGLYKTFHQNKEAKGIGLFISKNQIQAMMGSIRIESIVDQGTTLYLTLVKG